ncbi:HDOD domain-containing protein [Aliiglaciecola sp. CAU 1673]|uniref:HDOD domain-containing protein n=1 Tax=Aliiglaciecola sp. CAU 1673 TaxID=3032595 RepID=UPI0023DA0BF4|nr:HDOD domain-containing protein [Aliiglaciecola sp. CAU 1673]MDF2176965.1 HDOD domain-containing protein [Aliiglaciecola sp. CAU 1673]
MQATDYAMAVTDSFALPDACTRIKELLDDNSSTAQDIADVVSLDPSLSSKLLKLANSALYNFTSEISTISRAVNVIGGKALYSLVMTETASSAFKHFENNAIDLERFWQQSVFAALIAKQLAHQLHCKDEERFFLIGLLHNFGELAVAYKAPELAKQCEAYDEEILPWELQTKVMGFDYAECSSQILMLWNLPSNLFTPISKQHDLGLALKQTDVAILYLAVRIALSIVHRDKYRYQQLVGEDLLNCLKLTDREIEEATRFARIEAYKILIIMNPELFVIP